MCNSRNSKMNVITETKIDRCMDNIITFINRNTQYRTLGCCCGHNIYPMSIVVQHKLTGFKIELFTFKLIPRKRRFYKSDSKGFYYILEVIKKEGK